VVCVSQGTSGAQYEEAYAALELARLRLRDQSEGLARLKAQLQRYENADVTELGVLASPRSEDRQNESERELFRQFTALLNDGDPRLQEALVLLIQVFNWSTLLYLLNSLCAGTVRTTGRWALEA
jgi:hypothetical protein